MKKVKRVRPILQMERTECGAASLAMILAYYGKHVTLEEMRQDCSVSRNGVNAKNIVLAAELHGLSAKPVRVEAEDAERRLQEAVIAVKGKFGKNALLKAMSLTEKATARERNEQIGGHHA